MFLLAPILAACGEGSAEAAGADGRDSIRVRVVEHPASAWDQAPVWTLDAEPMLSIGMEDGPPEYELANVTGALRLEDGTVVVASAISGEIRFYDAAGVHLRSVGRRGGGPGEYRNVSIISPYGADSLLVWDTMLRRGTLLGRDGTLGRTFSAPDVSGDILPRGVFGDGSLVGQVSVGFRRGDLPNGVVRHEAEYIRFWPSGPADTLARLFAEEGYSSPGAYYYGLPFARKAVVAAAGEHLHYGSSDGYEIRTYTLSGDLARIIRSDRATPISRRDIARALERAGGRSREAFSKLSYQETMPAYADMKVDAAGNLWVADYLGPGEDKGAQQWTIFGPQGELRGTFTAPPRFKLHDIGRDYVLANVRDELDVERVVLYRLNQAALR